METEAVPAFGEVLRGYRTAAGLTQEELAERSGLSVRGISDLERGVKAVPHRATVTLLADALGLAAQQRALFAAARARGASRPTAAPATSSVPTHRAVEGLPLVGRLRELALLERHLRGDGPPVLLVAGEPGIGKTRLLHEAAVRAERTGWTVLWGGCQRSAGQEPYAPLLQALARQVQSLPVADLWERLRGCAWLVRLLPELATGPIEPLISGTLAPDHERRLLFAAVGRFLANVAGPAGTLLVLDDLQWASGDALVLLEALVRSSEERPLRVVGAYRDTEVGPQDALSGSLADLAHAELATQHTLGPLTPVETRQLLARALAERPVSQTVLWERVVERAGGVPFFVVSSAQWLCRDDLAAGAEEAVPWDVAQGIRQRVAALPAAARTVLGAAAVIGRVVPPALLLTVVGPPEEPVLAALEQVCRARLLVEDGPAYQFIHDVIREVVEADLGLARRMLLHRRVGVALAQQPEVPAVELAYHYMQAEAWPQTLASLMQAGDHAAETYANQDALAFYTQALEVCEQLGDSALPVAGSAAQKQAGLQARTENYQPAAAGYERMRLIARRLGDRQREGLALAYRGRAEVDLHAFEAAEQTLRAALALAAEDGYADVRLAALVGLVAHHAITGRLVEAEVVLRAAEEVAPQVQDSTIPRPERWRLYLDNWAGRFDAAVAQAEHVRGVAASLEQVAGARWDEALAYGGIGAYQRALALLEEAIATRERTGQVPLQALNTLGWIYGEIQNHDRALEWNTRGVAAAREAALSDLECLNHARLNLGDTLAALGLLDEAEEQYRAVEQIVQHPPDAWMVWRYAQHLFHSYGELWLTRGDVDRALAYADACLQLAEQTQSRKNIVKGRRLRGQALLTLGQLAEAEHDLTRALELAQAVGNPPQLWKTYVTLGELRQAQGRADDAHASYQAALMIIEQVGAELEDQTLRETFLESQHVRHVQQLASQPIPTFTVT